MLPLEPHQRRYTPRCPQITVANEPNAHAVEDDAAARDDDPDRLQTQKLGKREQNAPQKTRATLTSDGPGAVRTDIHNERRAHSAARSRGPTDRSYNMLNPVYKLEMRGGGY
jgi:hypothetical protein